jgi:hypothetical protein
MRKKTKKRIKRISFIIITSFILGIMLMIYTVLGPYRTFFWNVPYLAGFFGNQTYLVLLQNNNELRPSGGFITAVAEINMLLGVPDIKVFDSYQVPNPSPKLTAPEPFEYFIGQNDRFFAGWTLRDANFSPDFPTSARDVIALYQSAYPEKEIDGVVAIDFGVIEALLEFYGPISVEDVNFSAENFFIKSQRISKNIDTHNVNDLRNRKNVLKPFTKALTKRIVGNPIQWGNILKTMHSLTEEKHIQLYSSAETLQAKLEREIQSPRLAHKNSASDFLHVNVANIGGRKADRYVTKEIKYTADFSDPSNERSKLEIRLEHMGSYNIQSDIYQAYIRIYTPSDAKLISSSGTDLRSTQVLSELSLSVFSDYVRMKPGDTKVLSYEYRLPETVLAENYQLELIKQAGIQSQYWQVAVKQQNDSGMENLYLNPETNEMDIRENLALWRGSLDTDQHFHVMKSVDLDAPLILWQKFIDTQTINVRFQEAIDAASASNINNYQVLDKNESNALTDIISITKARFEGRDLWITVEGVTLQPEEHYQLIIRDLQDIHANVIQPNPLQRTLVQRIENN